MPGVDVSRRKWAARALSMLTLIPASKLAAWSPGGRGAALRLIVAYGEDGDVGVEQFLELLGELSCEIAERDTRVYLVTSQAVAAIAADAPELDQQAINYLRSLHHPTDTEFEIMLLDQDKGVIARADSPEKITQLLMVIDAIPLRQREIEERGSSC